MARGRDRFHPDLQRARPHGWTGAVDGYEVRDGAIVCKPGQGGTLYTRGRYRNFVVRLEFRLPPAGNNGLAIRYPGLGRLRPTPA